MIRLFFLSIFLLSAMAAAQNYDKTKVPQGSWYGDDTYFGYEYDMHANANDIDLGAAITVDYLVELFKTAGCDLLQTDTKGHEGLVSWYSKTPAASIAPGISKEMVDVWVKAGNELGIPCQAHYSGIFDMAAGEKFPDWNAVNADGEPVKGKMCPRSPYADELLIPQAKELISRYGVSAIWVDGEIWAVVPCYCDKCSAEYKKRYDSAPPRAKEDDSWADWIEFTRDSFQEYVAHYADEIHMFSPETKVCSNWLHSFRNPGCPWVPTDYISGDNLGTLSHPNNACHARFMSTRQRPWEIVLWGFYYNKNAPWVMKPLEMMQQQASQIIAFGGNINIYNQPKGHRDGRLVEWHMKRIGELGRFIKARKDVCQHTETIPNAVILHSEYDFYSQKSTNIWEYRTQHLEGALAAMIDNSIPTDILDEWALIDRIGEFPLVIAPSQENMSERAVEALKMYVRNGGRLIVTGPEMYNTLGGEFLGVESVAINNAHSYHIPVGGERLPLSSHGHQGGAWTEVEIFPWREVKPTTAKGFAPLTTTLFDEDKTDYFAATINRVGNGAVAYIPCDVMTYYYNCRYSTLRSFAAEVVAKLAPDFSYEIQAPAAVETVLRRKGDARYVHMLNRASGMPVFENIMGAQQPPASGPVSIKIRLDKRPESVRLLFESGNMQWEYTNEGESGILSALIPSVYIHSVLEVQQGK
jgi:hypothetical protein